MEIQIVKKDPLEVDRPKRSLEVVKEEPSENKADDILEVQKNLQKSEALKETRFLNQLCLSISNSPSLS